MADLLNIQSNEFPIGSIIDCVGPPNDNWLKCDGSVLLQSSYPDYVNLPDIDLHPTIWGSGSWEFVSVDSANTNYNYAISNIGNYIVVIGSGNRVWTSNDGGSTWSTNTNLPASGTWYCLANNGSRFVAVQYNSNVAAYSDNYGATWTSVTLPSTKTWMFITYDGSGFLVFNYSSTASNKYLYSSNGSSFTEYSVPYTDNESVASVGQSGSYTVIFVDNSSEYDGLYFYSSSDGINWSSRSDKWQGQLYDVSQAYMNEIYYFNNKWFGIYNYTGCYRYWINEDSNPITQENWIPNYFPPMFRSNGSYSPAHMVYTGEHYLLFNSGAGDDGIMTSKDGLNWQFLPSKHREVRGSVNNGANWVVCLPYSIERTGVFRSTGTFYNKSTHFQLPHFTGLQAAGMYKYIRVK